MTAADYFEEHYSMRRLINEEAIRREFIRYTSAYDLADPKIKLKYDHTFRVADLCRQIAGSISEDENVLAAAWLTGMLHDIARFEQVRIYNTFIDSESVDHAQFGGDLLFQKGLFENYVPSPVDENSEAYELYKHLRRLTEIAIRNHSAYRIQEGLSEEEQMYCHILRDADKIDILRVNYETPLEDIYNVTTEELKKGAVAPAVKEAFLERHAVLRSLKVMPVDHIVGHVSLVFELVYPLSVQIVKEQGFLDKLLNFESDNAETLEWFAFMRDYVWNSFA